jgi:predicted AAA+ superfamily ATPase
MDKERVKEYIVDWYHKSLPDLIQRDITIPSTSKIVTLIGPRRAGKTYILFQHMKKLLSSGIKKNQLIYLNCEDPRVSSLQAIELFEIVKIYWELYPHAEKEFFVFIDEPQVIPKWESAVRMFHDDEMKIFISGSSSKLLSKEIATSLRGRSLSYLVLPFSFSEYLKLKRRSYDLYRLGSKDKAALMNSVDEYLEFGGYAEIINEQDTELKTKIISEYFEIITYKDIIDRYKIKNTRLIQWLLKSSISSGASELSIRKVYLTLKSQHLQASKNTVYDYFSLLEDALFIFPISRHSFSERKKDFSINKTYINDNCFMKIVDSSKNIGKKMEQAVFLELLRRKRPLSHIFYYKNVQANEVDFVITEGNKPTQLIQVCQKVDDITTKQREIRSLIKAGSDLNCKNLIIITEDYQGTEEAKWFDNKGKITYIPLWKWLLS